VAWAEMGRPVHGVGQGTAGRRWPGAEDAVATSAKDLSKAAAVGAERAMKMRMG
jgi:hypothetical protein